MRLEDQVCSLELAKRLKKLGVKQESLFWWTLREDYTENGEPKSYIKDRYYEVLFERENMSNYAELVYSAFTASELGEMLPDSGKYTLGIWKKDGWEYSIHHYSGEDVCIYLCGDKNEANARAKLLIFLLENKLLTPSLKD